MKPSSLAIRHPVPVLVITMAILVFGILALVFLKREFVPSIILPSIRVVTLWPGVSAENVDEDVTEILEERFASLPGVNDIYSESREGISIIELEFDEKTNTNELLQEVRNRAEIASSDLPDDLAGAPIISTWGASDIPVFSFAISGPWNSDRITRYAEDVVLQEIYEIEGVADADILGGREKEVRISLNLQAIAHGNLTPLEVAAALKSGNVALPAGLVGWGGDEWALRVNGEFTGIDEIENLVVGGDNRVPIRLRDIATVSLDYERADLRVRSESQDMLVIQVMKQESGDAIRISREIRKRLAYLEEAENASYRFIVLHDDSETVKLALGTVMRSAVLGICMAVAVIFLFLRSWKYTLVIAVSLPISLFIAFAGMKLAGLSLNVLTLAGITVSLGMVVDSSIVVLESIHKRRLAGESMKNAALGGAASVSGAVTASITTSVSVFAPMIFLTGIVGSILKDISATIVLCLGASLCAALFLVPLLAHRDEFVSSKRIIGSRFMSKIERSYESSLRRVLRLSDTYLIAAAAVLFISIIAADLIGVSFLPAADYDELFVSLELRPGASIEEGANAADAAEAVIRREIPELENLIFFVGIEDSISTSLKKRETVWGQILLKKSNRRKRDFRDLMANLNEALPPELPGIAVRVFNGGFDRMLSLSVEGAGYRVELFSESLEDLKSEADRMEAILLENPEIISTTRDVRADRRFVNARFDRETMGVLGISAGDAARNAKIAFEGIDIGTYRPSEGESRSIKLSSNLESSTPDSRSLGTIPIRGAGGYITDLHTFTFVEENRGFSQYRRHNRARMLTVIGYTESENFRGINRRIKEALSDSPLKEGVEWRQQGVMGLISRSIMNLVIVLVISLLLVYVVMAIQFEKLIQPLIIMASVPFCFIGVVLGLAIFGSDISLVSFLGIVALSGIVVNNAIVQVDRINQLRKDGMKLNEALIQGSVSRLRPILMTTLTTFFGILPLSLASGSGAGLYAPLGQAIAGGLVTSTLVTLFLVPTLYGIVEKRRLSMSRENADTSAQLGAA